MTRRRLVSTGIAAGLAGALAAGAVLLRQPATVRAAADGAPAPQATAQAASADETTSASPAAGTQPGGSTVVLDPAAEPHAGLVLARVAAARGGGELEAYGEVLDPVPLIEAVLARRTARTALDTVQKEYARVKALHRDDANASARELEVAAAALERARGDRELAQARLTAAWGPELADRSDLDALVRELIQRETALARLDLPAGEDESSTPASVAVRPASGDGAALPARLIGPAPTTDPRVQGRGFLVGIAAGPPPGTALTGRLAFPERSVAGVRVPRSAVVWLGHQAYAFVALGGGRFERRAIELHADRAAGPDWLVTGALAPGESIVVSGASLLLSAERIGGARAD